MHRLRCANLPTSEGFHRFVVERLERRELFAGNVTVVQDAGDIRITGDNAANSVEIEPDANGDLSVRGLGTTTVNGVNSITLSLANPQGIDGNLIVNMRGGLDQVTVQGMNVTGDVSVNLGSTLDATAFFPNEFRFLDGTVAGDVSVRASSGLDYVFVRGSTIGGNVKTVLGSGTDRVEIDNTVISGEANLRLAAGDDAIGIFGSTASEWIVNMGRDDDVFAFFQSDGNATVRMGSGSDAVLVCNSTLGTSNWNMGSGLNDLAIFENLISDSMSFQGAAGQDSVVLEDVTFVSSVSMNLGADSDGIYVSNTNIFTGQGTFSGGGGADGIILTSGYVNSPDVTFDESFEFELPISVMDFYELLDNGKQIPVVLWALAGGDQMQLIC